ncbi:MAG: hypothetical protein JO317_03095 [Verrucomicrobiae bacterium]|nr:hypothetical protein [Verrucomicrobiae bacterium]
MGKFTGWSEDYILHELPLARGNQYVHATYLMEGGQTSMTPEQAQAVSDALFEKYAANPRAQGESHC